MSIADILDALERAEPGASEILLADAVWDEMYPQFIEARDALIGKALDPRVADAVSKSALRAYVNEERRGNDGARFASVILDEYAMTVDVAKAQQQIRRDGWVQYVNRDESGRFSRMSSVGSKPGGEAIKPYMTAGNTLPRELAPHFDRKGDLNDKDGPLKLVRAREYLEDWMQTKNLTAEMRERLPRGIPGKTDLLINYVGREPQGLITNWDKAKDFELGLENSRVHSYEIVPKSDLKGDELAEVTRALDAAQKMDLIGASAVTAQQMQQIWDVLNPDNQETTRLTRMSQLLVGAGSAANAVGMRGTGMALQQAAAAAGVGEQLRPMLTRAAYRYRGTEKTRPDQQFVTAAALAGRGDTDRVLIDTFRDRDSGAHTFTGDLAREAKAEFQRKPVPPKGEQGRSPSVLMPVIGQRLKMWDDDPLRRPATVDQVKLATQRDLVAQEFVRRQTRDFARRTKESTLEGGAAGTGIKPLRRVIQEIAQGVGRDLPSEGVVIDPSGKVAVQAVGIGGDHYQPFNIKGRKALDGGQYVRTRQLGGITTDDLRTLLVSNARAGMVVSASGVFDIEFDPEFRNQSRFKDQALSMVDTYERILDQLVDSEVYLRDLDSETTARLRQQAQTRSERSGEDFGVVYNRLRDAKRQEMSQLSPDDEKEIRDEAVKAGGTPVQISERYEQERQRRVKEKVRTLSLNAEGYEVALRTLQSYYPYFIRDVSRRDIGTFMEATNDIGDTRLAHSLAAADSATDAQYVRPGAVRSGNDLGSKLGLPNPKKHPYGADRDGKKDTGSETPAGGRDGVKGSGTPPSGQPPVRKPATDDVEPEAPTSAATPSATREDMSPELARAAATAANSQKQIFAATGQMFEGSSKELSDATLLWEQAHESDLAVLDNWRENAFKAGTAKPGQEELRALLNIKEDPKDTMRKMTVWLQGDQTRFNGLLDLVGNSTLLGSFDETRKGLNAAVHVAMALSLAGREWRKPGTPFDGRPAALPEFRDADDEKTLRAAIEAVTLSAVEGENGAAAPADVEKLLSEPITVSTKGSNLKDARTAIETKLDFNSDLLKRMKGAREMDAWLKSGTLSDGRKVSAAYDAGHYKPIVQDMLTNRDQANAWLMMHSDALAPASLSADRAAVELQNALDASPRSVQERYENTDKLYSAMAASLTLDAPMLGAVSMVEEGGYPKVGPLIGALEGSTELDKLSLDHQAQRAEAQMRRLMFGKSQQFRQGARVLTGSRWETLVKEQVRRGVPPEVAVLNRTRRPFN